MVRMGKPCLFSHHLFCMHQGRLIVAVINLKLQTVIILVISFFNDANRRARRLREINLHSLFWT